MSTHFETGLIFHANALVDLDTLFLESITQQLPILYLVQDNEWDISAHASETRAVDAATYAKGFGIKSYSIDGSDFQISYNTISQ